ncbi:hypothetical protein L6452_08313 [Arctium lappa]|uniref:Uncharacterized protein n=1 Tax=Arctium lappa TaxID=4217 RepID=A0ACB9DHZ2_ARCLA|nr:hypothetical protein L6452_08313 [Arctium lappa]
MNEGMKEGLFYALGLKGTNFRVLRTQLGGKDDHVIATKFEQVLIPQDLRFGTSEVNDMMATLVGVRYWDNDVMVVVILGMGTNACYVESMDAIPKLNGLKTTSGRTIVNTEWGAFSNDLPLTEFNREIDVDSINPGEQAVGTILYLATGVDSNLDAKKMVVEVCDTIAKRGGRLAGAGIVGILQKMEEDSKGIVFGKRTDIAMDEGLYEHHPQYRRYHKDAVTELLGSELSSNVVIEHSKDVRALELLS